MKKQIIKRLETKERRKKLNCKVYECKVDLSHLNNFTLNEQLPTLFLEAKWFENFCLSHKNIKDVDTTIKRVPVKIGKDAFEIRPFCILPAKVKQSIKQKIFNSLRSLSAKKKKGKKVGRLKYKSVVNSIPLTVQAYEIDFDTNRIKIVNIDQSFKVHGLHQIPDDAEIANANLIRKNGNYYIHITTFTEKQQTCVPKLSIGIDFGCTTQLTFSNDIKVEFEVPISEKIKRLDRKINKNNRKDSKNRRKDQEKRRKEYEKLTNRKTDIRRKIVNAIKTHYQYVCFQDESIHAWAMCNHGKKIQNTGIGAILADLKHKSVTPIMVNKWFASTQLCPICGNKQKLKLSERIYSCPCGYIYDRDIKSAICIEKEGMKGVPMDSRELKTEEIVTAAFLAKLMKINGVSASKLQSLSQ